MTATVEGDAKSPSGQPSGEKSPERASATFAGDTKSPHGQTAPGAVTAAIEGDPPHVRVGVTHGAGTKVLVDVAVPTDRFDEVSVDLAEVAGSEGRVFFAQRFGTNGEDEFSRDIEAWVIDALLDEVLWTGRGSYANSFGECETLDVPEVTLERGALVVRIAAGILKNVPDSERCTAKPLRRREVARVPLR